MIDVARMLGYDEWLFAEVEMPNHLLLLGQLFDTEFVVLVPHDDNRAEDGILLRDIYADNIGGPQGLSFLAVEGRRVELGEALDPTWCSVLEMMIGVAYRMENELAQGDDAKSMAECFEQLVVNLELIHLDDTRFSSKVVSSRLSNLIGRTYGPNGKCSLFPIKGRDWSQVEIWYQMSEWLVDNYRF